MPIAGWADAEDFHCGFDALFLRGGRIGPKNFQSLVDRLRLCFAPIDKLFPIGGADSAGQRIGLVDLSLAPSLGPFMLPSGRVFDVGRIALRVDGVSDA